MKIRDTLKNYIDKLLKNLIEDGHPHLHSLTDKTVKKKYPRTYHLNGQFDSVDIRKQTYE